MLSYNDSGLYWEQNDPLVLTCRAGKRQCEVLQCNNREIWPFLRVTVSPKLE